MIEALKIELTPEREDGTPKRLKIQMFYGGQEYEQRIGLVDNELMSLYDKIWDTAKEEFYNVLKKEN